MKYSAGDIVALEPPDAVDPAGGKVTYHWLQAAGPEVFAKGIYRGQMEFIAPEVRSKTLVEWIRIASDSRLHSTKHYSVIVEPKDG